MVFRNSLSQNMKNIHGESGDAWVANLPIYIDALCKKWDLSCVTPVDNMTFNYVAKAISNMNQAVVLKIGYDKKSVVDEMRALRYFNGDGSIELVDYDDKYNALLLQQAVPGLTLKSLNQTHVDTVLDCYVEVMQALHSKPLASNHGYPHISDWLMVLDNAAPENFPPLVLNKAIEIKNRLLKTSDTKLFLHGDLHLDNILQNGSQWIAIDPKGVVGDPAFEVFAFDFIQSAELANKSNIGALLASRSELIAGKSNLSAQRIKEWAFVRLILSAAWSIEDNCDPSWAIDIASILAIHANMK